MKYLLLALALSSCAKIRIKRWDHDSVTVCGNRWASEDGLAEKARERCGSSVELTGGNSEVAGSVDSGNGTSSVVHHDCNIYKCVRASQ